MMDTGGQAQSGLTLLETLVGLMLMAVVVGLLFDGLYVLGRTAQAGQTRLTETDRERVVQSFLRRRITESVPLAGGTENSAIVLFEGTDEVLRFFGELPAHRGGGGVHELRLALRPNGGRRDLTFSYRNAWPERVRGGHNGDGWSHVTLARNIRTLSLSYYGPASDEEAAVVWVDRWAGRRVLPRQVRIDAVRDDGRAWPPLIVSVQAREPAVDAHLIAMPDSLVPLS